MDLQQITYFLDVAETEHMTKSAERLHIAQPALSRSIARLEKEVGAQLFIRKGRGIKLSDEGRLLRRHLSAAASEIEQAQTEIALAREAKNNLVRIHIGAASLLAVDAISSWMTANPAARIELVQANRSEDQANVAIESSSARVKQTKHRFTERIMLAVPATMDFEEGRSIPLAAVSNCSFISLDGSLGFRRTCDALCAQHSFHPQLSLESDNPTVVRKTIALGLGVGFWPELSWGDPGERVRLVPLALPDFKRDIYVSFNGGSGCAYDFFRHLIVHMENVFSQRRQSRLF